MSSSVASWGRLMVLETELSTCFWKAACIRRWPSASMSWAVTKCAGTGASGFFSFHSL